MYQYNYLRRKTMELCEIIDVPKALIPDFGKENSIAHPYIEIKIPFLYLVVNENGIELERKKCCNSDQLLYLVFKKITFDMAVQYEVENRNINQDPRRVIFSYQLELMKKLSLRWNKSLKEEINNILLKAPYNDV